MAGAGLTLSVDTDDLDRVVNRLNRITNRSQMRTVMESIAEVGATQTTRRIKDEKTSPDGSAWEPLDPAYKAWKSKQTTSGGILEFDGWLSDIDTDSGDDYALWGSNREYALTHQFGDDSRGIPARPYLGLSDDNIDDILDLVERQIDAVLLR